MLYKNCPTELRLATMQYGLVQSRLKDLVLTLEDSIQRYYEYVIKHAKIPVLLGSLGYFVSHKDCGNMWFAAVIFDWKDILRKMAAFGTCCEYYAQFFKWIWMKVLTNEANHQPNYSFVDNENHFSIFACHSCWAIPAMIWPYEICCHEHEDDASHRHQEQGT
jgi:hypothetical protein